MTQENDNGYVTNRRSSNNMDGGIENQFKRDQSNVKLHKLNNEEKNMNHNLHSSNLNLSSSYSNNDSNTPNYQSQSQSHSQSQFEQTKAHSVINLRKNGTSDKISQQQQPIAIAVNDSPTYDGLGFSMDLSNRNLSNTRSSSDGSNYNGNETVISEAR